MAERQESASKDYRAGLWWAAWFVNLVLSLGLAAVLWLVDFGCSGDFMDSGNDISLFSPRGRFCLNVLDERPNFLERGPRLWMFVFIPVAITLGPGIYAFIARRPRWAKIGCIAGFAAAIALFLTYHLLSGVGPTLQNGGLGGDQHFSP